MLGHYCCRCRNGIVRIALLHDDTKDLLEGSHIYGINCVNRSDPALVYTLLQGNFIVNLDVGVRIEPFENTAYYVYGNDGVNGEGYYYPVYLSPVNLGQYHTHVIDCITYYMKNGSSNHAEPSLPSDSSLARAPGTCDKPSGTTTTTAAPTTTTKLQTAAPTTTTTAAPTTTTTAAPTTTTTTTTADPLWSPDPSTLIVGMMQVILNIY